MMRWLSQIEIYSRTPKYWRLFLGFRFNCEACNLDSVGCEPRAPLSDEKSRLRAPGTNPYASDGRIDSSVHMAPSHSKWDMEVIAIHSGGRYHWQVNHSWNQHHPLAVRLVGAWKGLPLNGSPAQACQSSDLQQKHTLVRKHWQSEHSSTSQG